MNSSKNVDISIDPFTGRNPGYAFIDFDNKENADLALEVLFGQCIRDRSVKVNLKTGKRAIGQHPV